MSIKLESYLVESHTIDWMHPSILDKARQLKGVSSGELALVEASFNYVRDAVMHSTDAASVGVRVTQITSKASDVLAAKTGYCFAKSHLLAALLRANNIPAGFSYQRLSLGNGQFCLHGLNSVYLPDFGWHKLDARGNNDSVDTYFKPPEISLAFSTDKEGEQESTVIYEAPLGVVLDGLKSANSLEQMNLNLPDLELQN